MGKEVCPIISITWGETSKKWEKLKLDGAGGRKIGNEELVWAARVKLPIDLANLHSQSLLKVSFKYELGTVRSELFCLSR